MRGNTATNWIIGMLVVLIVLIVGISAYTAWRRRDRFTLEQTHEIKSGKDGLAYRVHLVHKDPERAADTMAELNHKAVELMRHLRKKYVRSSMGRIYPGRAHATKRLLGLYNPDNLAENSPRDPEGDTSYTIDKGAILALCLREKTPGRETGLDGHDFHNMETLTFVTLHELTHIAIEDQDHPPRFWEAFKFILLEAREAGLIKGVNYNRHPTVYCGMDIDYSPLYDPGLSPIS
jgi:hypothetical protein